MAAAVAAFALGAFAQEVEEGGSQSWRLSVGGFGRGSMRMRPLGMPGERFEMYGVDADVMFKTYQTDKFDFWAGVGFGWAPNQRVYNETVVTPIGGGFSAVNSEKNDLQYGELRLMVVPEWKMTDDFSLGVRLGVAFDWTRCKNKWEGGIVPGGAVAGDSETYSDFLAQGIVGLQGMYMFSDNLGLYAAIDWRGGSDPTLKNNGLTYGKLSMDGWYSGVGLVVQF